uniref:Uncharacterized protein n=1 Tax=Phytophthora ramorum TaxID=164328 RepID=H3HAS5_PHYRM
MWKSTIGYAGLVLAGYEAILLLQLLTGSSYTSRLPLCLGLKLVAFASIMSTREYVRAGRSHSLVQSLFFSGSYVLIWLCCSTLLHLNFSAVEASPLCILYFLASFGVLRLIGDNTKAEVARAQQLEKLQRLVGSIVACLELPTMADRLIHQRVFKVSKALNRLHRRQMESREGLPDWEKPRTPAGKASKRYETTPAFFAWDEEPKQKQQSTWQTQSPQEDTAIEVDSDDRSEEEQPQVVGRSITELLRLEDPRKQQLVRIYPKYVRLRQGSEIRYRLKLTRPPSKGKGVMIHVRVIMNKIGITASPTQLVVTSKDWRQTREITVASSQESELRTFQIHHKINETYDEVYNATALLPSLFVSVLQKEATFLFGFGCGIDGRLGTNGDTNTTMPTPFSSRWLHPLQLACGKAHSAIVDVYSNLYCFGSGSNGQLGQGDAILESSQEPMRVPHLTSTCVQYVACGSHHTLCMSVDGRVFAWGDNSFGQLGMGSKSAQPVATPVRVDRI